MPGWILCILDGPLADSSDRRNAHASEADGRPIAKDALIPMVAELLISLDRAGHRVYIFADRPLWVEQETIEWLKTHKIPYARLIMHPSPPEYPPALNKMDMIWAMDRAMGLPMCVIDTDESSIRRYRAAQIPCLRPEI